MTDGKESVVYCSQCGSIIEDGADFCYNCGNLRVNSYKVDDDGNLEAVSDRTTRVCPYCGYSNPFNDDVCRSCGRSMSGYDVRAPKTLDSKDWTAIAIGLVGGLIGICGLGQFVYRRFARGLPYFVLSAIVFYVEIRTGFSMATTGLMLIRMLGFFIFFKSCMDLFQLAYYPDPPVDDEKGERNG